MCVVHQVCTKFSLIFHSLCLDVLYINQVLKGKSNYHLDIGMRLWSATVEGVQRCVKRQIIGCGKVRSLNISGPHIHPCSLPEQLLESTGCCTCLGAATAWQPRPWQPLIYVDGSVNSPVFNMYPTACDLESETEHGYLTVKLVRALPYSEAGAGLWSKAMASSSR